jgi:hypothetical protein
VIRALRKSGIFVDPMEVWTAESDEPKVFSQDRVKRCDFCVLLVAFRRGYVPKNKTRSITQLEYEAAIARRMDVLVYLLNEKAAWPKRFNELHSDARLRAWRADLERKHGRALFRSAPSSIDIAPAITRWFVKHTNPVVADLSGYAVELSHHEDVLRRRRKEVTSYLEDTRDLIKYAHNELAKGQVPHGTCQQIYDTGKLLVSAIGKDLPRADLNRLRRLLKRAYNVEMLHDALSNESDRRLNLAELDRIRGSFDALVKKIRVSPPAPRS